MSAENLNHIAQSELLTNDLRKLIAHQLYLESRIQEYKTQMKDIKINYTAMGITDKEFRELTLYIDKPELLYHDLATKEQYIPFVEKTNE